MNMKKTIAAVAAASLAVSAMAATVSAAEARTYPYNLVREIKKNQKTPLTMTARFDAVPLTIEDGYFNLYLGNTVTPGQATPSKFSDSVKGTLQKITVTGNYTGNSQGGGINPIVFTTDKGSNLYNVSLDLYSAQQPNTASWWAEFNNLGLTTGGSYIAIPIVENTQAKNTLIGSNAVSGVAATVPSGATTVKSSADTWTYTDLSASAYADTGTKVPTTAEKTALNELNLASGTYRIAYGTSNAAITVETLSGNTWGTAVNKTLTTGLTSLTTAGDNFVVTVVKNPGNTYGPGAFAIQADNVNALIGNKLTAKNTYTLQYGTTATGTGWYCTVDPSKNDVTGFIQTVGGSSLANAVAGDTILFTYEATSEVKADIIVTVEWSDLDASVSGYKNKSDLNGGRIGDTATTYGVNRINPDLTWTRGRYDINYEPEEKTLKVPFKTQATGYNDIISYLESTMKYWNVGVVINDAIQTRGTVTFTFHTATDKISYGVLGNDGTIVSKLDAYQGKNEDKVNPTDEYARAVAAAGGNADNVVGFYDADNGTSRYKAFGDVGYWTWYDDENKYNPSQVDNLGWTDFVSPEIFAGALIINEQYTMGLSDVAKFDWTSTTLSFDWDAIADTAYDAGITNAYAIYVHNMRLATSTTWFWDSMDLTLAATEEEDVGTGEGVEGDTDVIDDTEGEELGDEDLTPDEPEEPADEPEEPAEVDEPEEVAPVVEEENPKTGNSAVALAVIPVALAAAAVVAKKRS